MADVLFVKTSSLGDVIHHMPALTEARARRPDARFAWVVEDAFAPLVRLHPAVATVIPVAVRRWRGALFRGETWREIRDFLKNLRARNYDDIVDTQGLIRTAVIAHRARGRSHGYDSDSIKERAASFFYDVKHNVSRSLHAIERNRLLTAHALGYEIAGAPNYGLDRGKIAPARGAPYGVLLHATARVEKQWPEANWRTLAEMLGERLDLIVPFGNAEEQARSVRIAEGIARARVPDRQPLDKVAQKIAGATFVVGVDTGLLHLAAAFGVPLVAIFGHSNPELTGPRGAGPIKVMAARSGGPPSAEQIAAEVERILAPAPVR